MHGQTCESLTTVVYPLRRDFIKILARRRSQAIRLKNNLIFYPRFSLQIFQKRLIFSFDISMLSDHF